MSAKGFGDGFAVGERKFTAASPAIPPVGAKVYVASEKRPYTVRAASRRFAVCTKPFNPQRTVLYCILDTARRERGPEDLVFCFGAETDEQCEQMLRRMERGDTGLSRRRSVPWDVVRVALPRAKRVPKAPNGDCP